MSKIHYCTGDLPDSFVPNSSIAIDTETNGLKLGRDRLCALQLSNGDGEAYVIRFDAGKYEAPNLRKVLSDDKILKIFQYARFDLAFILMYMKIAVKNVYCTRIASTIARTNAASHSLKALCKEFVGIELEKEMQRSDWGALSYSEKQLEYAANDVLYLHKIREGLEEILHREGRAELAYGCFAFLPHRALLDVSGFQEGDIFSHDY